MNPVNKAQKATRRILGAGTLVLLGLAGCMDDKSMGGDNQTAAKTITVKVKNKSMSYASYASGSYGSAPAKPGNAFTFDFYAPKGSRFSFASMFGQSNDWFFAPDTMGIALYDGSGNPVSGDVTSRIHVWDAGTEEDQPPLQGSNQAPRQSAANTGPADPINMVRMVPAFPVGKFGSAPTLPGDSLAFEFTAPKGTRLSFACMFGQSNDWFFAPDTDGIALWDGAGMPVSGDVTSKIKLWDAGTEMDEPIGSGPNQAPRQSAPNTGAPDPDTLIRMVTDTAYADPAKTLTAMLSSLGAGKFRLTLHVIPSSPTPISPVAYQVHLGHDALFTQGTADAGKGLEHLAEDGNPSDLAASLSGYDFGNAGANMKVTLTSLGDGKFEAKIMALAGGVTPLSPVSWSVHNASSPLFTPGMPAPEGLEPQSEDGNPKVLAASLAKSTGIGSPLSPVAWAVAGKHDLFFTEGEPDFGKGLESLAEEGNPASLHASLSAMGLQTGTVGTAPIKSGEEFSFDIEVKPGDTLFLASMFGQSNDAFYAPTGMGIALWDGSNLRTGNVTSDIRLWDAGTEGNEPPGVGANQAPRQTAPNTGAPGEGKVQIHNDGFVYPPVSDVIEVDLSAK